MGGGGGGWSEGEITTKLSPAGAGTWAELGNSKCGLQAGTELGQAQLLAQTICQLELSSAKVPKIPNST